MAHIGDVPHIAHLVAQMAKVAEDDVEGNGRARVAQVRVAVDRGAADIHAYPALHDGDKLALHALLGIVYV